MPKLVLRLVEDGKISLHCSQTDFYCVVSINDSHKDRPTEAVITLYPDLILNIPNEN